MIEEKALPDSIWLLRRIEVARTMRRLERLGEIIADDKADGAEYTRDEEALAILRRAYEKRAREIQEEERWTG